MDQCSRQVILVVKWLRVGTFVHLCKSTSVHVTGVLLMGLYQLHRSASAARCAMPLVFPHRIYARNKTTTTNSKQQQTTTSQYHVRKFVWPRRGFLYSFMGAPTNPARKYLQEVMLADKLIPAGEVSSTLHFAAFVPAFYSAQCCNRCSC